MAAYYNILGQKIASQYLVFATWGALYAGVKYAQSGKPVAANTPAIQPAAVSSSAEEEAFIREFLAAADKDVPAKH